jgi:hypothetical protein
MFASPAPGHGRVCAYLLTLARRERSIRALIRPSQREARGIDMKFRFYNESMFTSPVAQCLRDHLVVTIAHGGCGSSG